MPAQSLILDTDVLIDVLRQHPSAVAFLEKIEVPLLVSVMTCVELWTGVKGGKEEKMLNVLLTQFYTIPVSEAIAERACDISYRYHGSHGIGAVDAVIAASAELEGATLVTLNKKHFSMLKHVLVPYKKH